MIATAESYTDFIQRKHRAHNPTGIEPESIHEHLFDFQADTVKWSLKKGRSCIFAGTGLGKTLMQCEWGRHFEGRKLIVAPLAVGHQTIHEARSLGMKIRPIYSALDLVGSDGVFIVNYDRLHLVGAEKWDAVILDESSIIKSHDGKFRNYITDVFRNVPYRLACTATPSPNDYMELATHAEFCGAMSRSEMLATFFTHDGGDTSKWRLKGHAKKDFWRWVASWAAVYAHPADLGYDTPGYDLPELKFQDHLVDVPGTVLGGLFGDGRVSATKTYAVLRESADVRTEIAAKIVAEDSTRSAVIWCHTDEEQKLLEKMIPGAASVKGSQSVEEKERGLQEFSGGAKKQIITKPKIAGFGLNWQHCDRMIFCGVTYSFEQIYQAIRRCWRFGQKNPVTVHMVTCNAQSAIVDALRVKQEAFTTMAQEVKKYCAQEIRG